MTTHSTEKFSISIVEVEGDDHSPAQVDLALRTLARLFVRDFRRTGDPAANVPGTGPTIPLTVLGHQSVNQPDEAA